MGLSWRSRAIVSLCRIKIKSERRGELLRMASQPYLGGIFLFAGNFAPRGYMLCQGQVLPIAQYTALFSILGTTYGGNGSTNFQLPDLRGRAPIGEGTGPGLSPVTLGQASGSQSVSILANNMPSHNHVINVSTAPATQNAPQNNFIGAPQDANANPTGGFNTTATAGATLAPASVGLSGGSLPLGIQNPYLGLNYIIAIQGIFPSRN
jgi:microcystin-dependent protein